MEEKRIFHLWPESGLLGLRLSLSKVVVPRIQEVHINKEICALLSLEPRLWTPRRWVVCPAHTFFLYYHIVTQTLNEAYPFLVKVVISLDSIVSGKYTIESRLQRGDRGERAALADIYSSWLDLSSSVVGLVDFIYGSRLTFSVLVCTAWYMTLCIVGPANRPCTEPWSSSNAAQGYPAPSCMH